MSKYSEQQRIAWLLQDTKRPNRVGAAGHRLTTVLPWPLKHGAGGTGLQSTCKRLRNPSTDILEGLGGSYSSISLIQRLCISFLMFKQVCGKY